MAGFSLVLLLLLFFWPAALVVAVAYLVVNAAALIITSPAFPAFIISLVAGAWGTVAAALVLWRWHKDPEANPVSVRSFTKTFVLYAISFVAFCVGIYLAGVALLTMFPLSAEADAEAAAALLSMLV